MKCAPRNPLCQDRTGGRCRRSGGTCHVPAWRTCDGCGMLVDVNGSALECYGWVVCVDCEPDDVLKIEESTG